jgi:pterin-4a-carbinolamine dehydratase
MTQERATACSCVKNGGCIALNLETVMDTLDALADTHDQTGDEDNPADTAAQTDVAGTPADTADHTGVADMPDPLGAMKALARGGDLTGLLDAFIKSPQAATLRQMESLVRWSVKEAGKKSPRQFTREVYREAMAFLAYVQMRLHTQAVRFLADGDAASQAPLDELVEKLLPHIERLMRLAQELSQSWATTTRQWKLARPRGGQATGGRRRRPRNGNEWYRQLVEDGIVPEIRTCD